MIVSRGNDDKFMIKYKFIKIKFLKLEMLRILINILYTII